MNKKKSVIVIDTSLPLGQQVNAAAVLAATLGERVEGLIGPDVTDASGENHLGLIHIPLPILSGTSEQIAEIRLKAREATASGSELITADFSEPAQIARTYEDYTDRVGALSSEAIKYLGVALYGEARRVTKLTGSLPLLR